MVDPNQQNPNNPIINFYTQYNLLCYRDDNNKLISINKSKEMSSRFPMMISLGEMIGGFVINILSDIIGRKKIILYGGLIWLLIRIITNFVDH